MTTKNLLIELLVEELPPKALKMLGTAFANLLTDSLKAQGLTTAISEVKSFATPRRLAVHCSGVLAVAEDRTVALKLMPLSIGLDAAGKPTQALLKRLAALGAAESVVPALRRQLDGKAESLYFDNRVSGVLLADGLQKALDEAIAKLPVPKIMQYQLDDGWTSVDFVRPVHGLVALHGEQVVAVSALGLQAGRNTHGHRFEAMMDPVVLQHADYYAEQLADQGAVIASFETRRADIEQELLAEAKLLGLTPIDDPALLDEVTALVERPNVLRCQFEAEYLAVPPECLILTMKANQKYFPLLDVDGQLTNHFLVVSNITPTDASRIIEGNERVVRPRLADARFFFDQDRKKTLADRVAGLDKVVYHGKLGSQGERVHRVRAIAREIGRQLGGATLEQQADEAARLAKADLLTDMVGEFPELQGIMGGYYARHDGLTEDIAFAIEDHYKPRFAGDVLPRNRVGLVVALADKIETLVGLFGIGQLPTGDKDPFALRRHALGVIRMLVEHDLPLSLHELIQIGERTLPDNTAVLDQLLTFFYDRFAGSLRDQGFSSQEIEAVLALRPPRLAEVPRRLAAVRAFAALPEAPALAAANKRVGNILKKAELSGQQPVLDRALLVEPAEIALANALADVEPAAVAAFEAGDHTASLRALAALKQPVDAFFEKVMVNAADPAQRANRLGLLVKLHAAMNRTADLSKLAA